VASDASAAHEATECIVADTPLGTRVPGRHDSIVHVGARKVHPSKSAPMGRLLLLVDLLNLASGVLDVRVHLFAVL